MGRPGTARARLRPGTIRPGPTSPFGPLNAAGPSAVRLPEPLRRLRGGGGAAGRAAVPRRGEELVAAPEGKELSTPALAAT